VKFKILKINKKCIYVRQLFVRNPAVECSLRNYFHKKGLPTWIIFSKLDHVLPPLPQERGEVWNRGIKKEKEKISLLKIGRLTPSRVGQIRLY
jgi:hypothetical protein